MEKQKYLQPIERENVDSQNTNTSLHILGYGKVKAWGHHSKNGASLIESWVFFNLDELFAIFF